MRQPRLPARAQLFLHARRLVAVAAAAVLLTGHSASLSAALQLRSSQLTASPPFSASPAAFPSTPLLPASAPAPSFVGDLVLEQAAAVGAPPLNNKRTTAAARAASDGGSAAAASGAAAGLCRSPAAAASGSADALPLAAVLRSRRAAAAAAVRSARRSTAAVPAAGAAAAAPTARLAFLTDLPAVSPSRSRGQLQSTCITGKCSSWSGTSQQQAYQAAAAGNGGKQGVGQQKSWLARPLKLQHQRLAARPSGALEGGGCAVVEGEKVNGKSVRDWTVERTLYQALHMALAEEMQRDPSVCVMGEDVGHYGGSYKVTKDLHAVFGNLRVMDTPICENTFTGMAIGAAMNGLRPVVEGMNMGFLLLAFNQISNNAGMVRYTSGGNFDVPVVIRGPGGVGKQLGPEHSQRIEAYLMAVPGLKMVACSTPYNARGLLKSAIRENNPVVFFEHVLTYNVKESIPLLPYTLPLDRAEVARQGSDVTLLAYGKLRYVALDAAKQLDSLGISAEVLDLVSLKPLDMGSICKSVRKTGRCIILDESSRTGGIGGEILSQVVENCADELLRPPVRLATKDIPTPYARELEDATIVTPADVVNAALWMLSSRSQPTVARHVA